MCGHVGMVGNLTFKDEAMMKRLLVLDYFRGPDSTGLASIRANGSKIAKIASHPFDLFDCVRFTNTLNGFQSNAFIGHNRLATKGKVNGSNAHPFECGSIIGAHNGTLDVPSFLELKKLAGQDYDVDSEAVFACIAKVGIEETIKHMTGAWALVWYDADEDAMFFLRNKERPLWYAFEVGFKKMYWASEWEMIKAANGMLPNNSQTEIYKSPDKGYRWFPFEENVLYRVPIQDILVGTQDIPDYRVKELKGKEKAIACYTPPFGSNVSHLPSIAQQKTLTATKQTGVTTCTDVPSFIHMKCEEHDPFGGFLDKERFDEIAKYGCSWCGADVSFEDKGVAIYEDIDAVLCPSCHNSNGTNRLVLSQEALEECL